MFFAQQEQRSFKRMELDLPITITKGSLVTKGICKDLSSTGMSITFSDKNLQVDDNVQIQIATNDQRFPPLDADAILIRVDKMDHGFSAAVQFISMK